MAPFSLRSVAGLAFLAAFAAAAADQQYLEIDVIFPHNDSYIYDESVPDIIPIAFNIQNYTASLAHTNFSISWYIEVWPYGTQPGGAAVDAGVLQLPLDANGDPVTLVGFTDPHIWTYQKRMDDKYLLHVKPYWASLDDTCLNDKTCIPHANCLVNTKNDMGSIMFAFGAANDPNFNSSAVPLDIPDCPAFGGRLQVENNATAADRNSTCQLRADIFHGPGDGNPCAATVDAAAKSSIQARASSLAYDSTHIPIHTTHTKTNAAFAAMPTPGLAPVLAAAMAYGMAQ